LYASHIPTTLLQRALLAAGSAVAGLVNPQRQGALSASNVDGTPYLSH
jgi:hypothetical protein